MLNISRQIYAAWNTTGQSDPLPHSEIVPFGDTTNEKKRLETVTKKFSVIKEFDNVPLPGFTLYSNNRKNYGSSDSTWLVIDPRGFMVRITNSNLEDILHVTGITEGLIQEECVWARSNAETRMVLVPVSAPSYLEAVENTELLEGKVSIKDVAIGDKVLLQNKIVGIFMGTASLYGPINSYSFTHDYKPIINLRRQIVMVEPHKYYYQTDLKILKVLEKATTVTTRDESVAAMNADIAAGIGYFSSVPVFSKNYVTARDTVKHVSVHAEPRVKLTIEQITKDEAALVFEDARAISDFGMLLLVDSNNRQHLIDFPYMATGSTVTSQAFTTCRVTSMTTGLEDKVTLEERRNFYASNTVKRYSLDSFAKYYKIIKNVRTGSYV